MNDKELKKELEERGTAERTNGVVNQATQALDENETKAKFITFGELREQNIIPIEEACAKCSHCYFDTVKRCQERQAKDARARGFNTVICPSQFQ